MNQALITLSCCFWRMTPAGRTGLVIFLGLIFLALAAPIICPRSHKIISGPALIPPGHGHFLGMDELGPDLPRCPDQPFHRSWHRLHRRSWRGGAGILAGYAGGRVDMAFMRLVDIIQVLPDLPVMIVLAAFFGPSLLIIVLVLSCFSWVHTARIVRSRILTLKQRQYIRAAALCGAGPWYLI